MEKKKIIIEFIVESDKKLKDNISIKNNLKDLIDEEISSEIPVKVSRNYKIRFLMTNTNL